MKSSILISGFGGQGLMSLGKIIAKIALLEGKHTSWFPSYGPEMRGGTAHCFVKVSDLPIASPFVNTPDIAIILNQPSYDKFKDNLESKSILILNSDLMKKTLSVKKDIRLVNLPLNKMALECGNIKVVNIIALGVLSGLKGCFFKEKTAIKVLTENFSKGDTLEVNLRAFKRGMQAISV